MAESANWGFKGRATLLVVLAAVVALAVAVPVFRVILLISLPLGGVVAAGLYLWHKKRPIKEVEQDSIKLNLK